MNIKQSETGPVCSSQQPAPRNIQVRECDYVNVIVGISAHLSTHRLSNIRVQTNPSTVAITGVIKPVGKTSVAVFRDIGGGRGEGGAS